MRIQIEGGPRYYPRIRAGVAVLPKLLGAPQQNEAAHHQQGADAEQGAEARLFSGG